MLRPQLRSQGSVGRALARSPRINPTDDDHPLLSVLDVESPDRTARSPMSAASQLDALLLGAPHDTSADKEQFLHSPRARKAPSLPRLLLLDADDVERTEVYMHKVVKSDTLPKIILQYQIDSAILRRANRIWANDSIQFRDQLLLPVAACNITPRELRADEICGHELGTKLIDDTTENSTPQTSDQVQKGSVKSNKAGEVIRRVVIVGIGVVDVVKVHASSLSYFPPSTHKEARRPSTSSDTPESSSTKIGRSRDSFETLRDGTGKALSTAYNGTTNLIRKIRERKNNSTGINLIEF